MRHAGAVVLACLVGCGGCSSTESRVVSFYATSGEQVAEFMVFEALSAEMRREGLRALPPLATGTGLLLAFPVTGEVCIGNAGVPYPIDAVYIGPPGDTVVSIERDIPALDESARCVDGIHSVLEVRAGEAAELSPGDRLARSGDGYSPVFSRGDLAQNGPSGPG